MKTKILCYTIISFLCFAYEVSNAQTPSWVWGQQGTSTQSHYGVGVCTDINGNVYMTGYFNNTIIFGSDTLHNVSGNSNIYIVKYSPSGNVIWARKDGGLNTVEPYAICSDSHGFFYLTGSFFNSTIIGTTTLTSAGNYDIFVAKYDTSGNVIWAVAGGGTYDDIGYGIATDASGNIFVTGAFAGINASFGTLTLTHPNTIINNSSFFVVKYNSSGNAIWARAAGTDHNDYGKAISTDANGNILVTGVFSSSNITFGTTAALTGAGNDDIFVAKYDASGNALWAARAGGTNNDEGNGIITDANGNVYAIGSFRSTSITFGSTTINNTSNSGYYWLFIVKYNSAGTVLWAKGYGSSYWRNNQAFGIARDVVGNTYTTGYYESNSISFGSFTLNNTNTDQTNDIYIVKHDPSGNVLWAKGGGGQSDDQGSAIALNGSGNVFITGYFSSPTIIFGIDTLKNSIASGESYVAALSSTNVSISENINENFISIYPNPVTENITIEAPQKATIEILNIAGQTILQRQLQQGKTDIDISRLAKGVYFLRLCSNDKTAVSKIVKE